MPYLRLLGGASIEGPAGPITGRAAQRRRVALLATLALTPDRPVSRDRLIALLWPESDTDRARHLLADSLYVLRSGLGEDAVLAAGDDVRLNPARIDSDVAQFERAVAEGDFERAVTVYAGPFLDGFFLPGAAGFERWVEAERARLAQRYATALEELAERAVARGDARAALECSRQLAAQEPYSARGALRLMRALDAAGDRAGALQHAQVHAALLRTEFDAEPDPEVAALAERLRHAPATPARGAGGTSTSEPGPGGDPSDAPPAADAARATGPMLHEGPLSTDPSHAADAPDATRATTRAASAASSGRRRAPLAVLAGGVAALALAAVAFPYVRATRLAPGAAAAALPHSRATTRAVAVLPFVNMSGDAADAYFSDGLTEALMNALGRVDGLRVTGRASAFALKGKALDLRAIRDTLGVEAVLEGSVRRAGGRLRVSARLVDATSGYQVWSDEYDRELEDVFAVQDAITRAIVDALRPRLAGGRRMPVTRDASTDFGAYEAFLQGRYFWTNHRTPAGLDSARAFYEQAVARDSGFALAYAGLADIYNYSGFFGYMRPKQASPAAREAALRALALDSLLPEAHAALAYVYMQYDWNWPAAEREIRRALELNPSFSLGHRRYAYWLATARRFDEAIAEAERALALDPLDGVSTLDLGFIHWFARQPDRGIAHVRRLLAWEPAGPLAPLAHWTLGHLYTQRGMRREAAEAYRRAGSFGPARIEAAILAGRRDSALVLLGHEEGRARREYVSPFFLAGLYAAIGERERALDRLERAYAEREGMMMYLRIHPTMDPLRSEPRFQALVARVGRE